MFRAGWDELMVPKLPLLVVTFGSSKLTWFSKLNESAVKRRFQPSRIRNTFLRERSQFSQPGPWMIPTPAFPSAVAGALEKAAVLNQWSGPR